MKITIKNEKGQSYEVEGCTAIFQQFRGLPIKPNEDGFKEKVPNEDVITLIGVNMPQPLFEAISRLVSHYVKS